MNRTPHPYRVFISFSHADRENADQIARHLRENLHVKPGYSGTLLPGTRFAEQIKEGLGRDPRDPDMM